LLHWKTGLLINAQVLGRAGCHYSEEEISRHLKTKYWPVQINGNKFATGQILKKPVEIVKGQILAGLAQKSPEPWGGHSPFRTVASKSHVMIVMN